MSIAGYTSLQSAAPFWTTGGGAQAIDNALGVPLFSPSSIVIRGGKVRISVTNRSNDESVRVRVWALWAKSNQAQVTIPASAPTGWDPTMIPDFSQAYKMLFGREVLLLPGARPMEVEAVLKPQKIDQDTFLNEVATKIIWVVAVGEIDDVDGSVSNVGIQTTHSLSFTGDAFT